MVNVEIVFYNGNVMPRRLSRSTAEHLIATAASKRYPSVRMIRIVN